MAVGVSRTRLQHPVDGNFPAFPGYSTMGILGQGGYGTVYLCQNIENPSAEVAIKLIRRRNGEMLPAEVLREMSILGELRGEQHIVQLESKGMFSNLSFYVVMRHAGESLTACIRRTALGPQKYLNDEQVDKLLHGLFHGLHQIPRRSIMHRDLKPCNLLVDRHGELAICDFGTAKVHSGSEPQVIEKPMDEDDAGPNVTRVYCWPHTGGITTYPYAAPEMLKKQVCGLAVDVWAVGCILYEIKTSKPLFWTPGDNATREAEHVINTIEGSLPQKHCFCSSLIAEVRPGTAPFIYKIVDTAIQIDPKDRPTAEYLKGNYPVRG